MTNYKIHRFPNSRIASIDVCEIGKQKHHVTGLVEISVHPICFGIGSIIREPSVIDDRIEIREILNMSVLIDHDVIDGAPMV